MSAVAGDRHRCRPLVCRRPRGSAPSEKHQQAHRQQHPHQHDQHAIHSPRGGQASGRWPPPPPPVLRDGVWRHSTSTAGPRARPSSSTAARRRSMPACARWNWYCCSLDNRHEIHTLTRIRRLTRSGARRAATTLSRSTPRTCSRTATRSGPAQTPTPCPSPSRTRATRSRSPPLRASATGAACR